MPASCGHAPNVGERTTLGPRWPNTAVRRQLERTPDANYVTVARVARDDRRRIPRGFPGDLQRIFRRSPAKPPAICGSPAGNAARSARHDSDAHGVGLEKAAIIMRASVALSGGFAWDSVARHYQTAWHPSFLEVVTVELRHLHGSVRDADTVLDHELR